MIPSQTVEMYSGHIDELALATHHSCLVATGARNKSILHFITGRWAASIFDMSNCTEWIATHRNLHGQLHRNPVSVENEGHRGNSSFSKNSQMTKESYVMSKES